MYNVLLVDNEPAILSALSHAIDWAAHDCHILNIARDGREAMLQCAQEAPDIGISDVRMPEVDGLELARWISENYPACKVIILTGFPDFSYAQQAINYRVVDFVLKPTSEDSLLAALDKAKQRLAEDQVRKTDKQADVLACALFLHQLLFDPVQSLLYTMERTNALGLDLSSCYVLRFGLDDIHTEADRIAFQSEVREMWRQAMGEHTIYFIPRGERFCYIILCAPVGFDPTEACHQVVQTVQQTTDFQITVGISAHHHSPLELSDAAREADHAQQLAEYSPPMPVISYGQLPLPHHRGAAHHPERTGKPQPRCGHQRSWPSVCLSAPGGHPVPQCAPYSGHPVRVRSGLAD